MQTPPQKQSKLDTNNSRTVCHSDTRAPQLTATPHPNSSPTPKMSNQRRHHQHPREANSESAERSEMEVNSEVDRHHYEEGSYQQYNGANHNKSHHHTPYSDHDNSDQQASSDSDDDRSFVPSTSDHSLPRSPPPKSHNHHRPNSFDQIAEEVAEDLQVFDEITQVEEQELHEAAELIPERNTDRLFSSDEPREHNIPIKTSPREPHEEHSRQAPLSSAHDNNQRPDSHSTLGPPPSFSFRSERLSRNVADAMATIWDRFWSDDLSQICSIIQNRFGQLMPYIRRFLAHLVAFWGGITYIRRALTAFIRILNKDERVRELLERIGWASATTLRVFLSMCAMILSATLQFYYLVRDKIIPDTRRIVPIVYYKSIVRLLQMANNSPWSLFFGPFSLTFAIDADKVPDKYFLHHKLSVPRDDITFSVPNVVQTIRETVYRTRYGHQRPTAEPSRKSVPLSTSPHHAAKSYDQQTQHHHEQNHGVTDEVKGEFLSRSYVPTETAKRVSQPVEDDFISKTYIPTEDGTTPDFISRTYVPPEAEHIPDSYTESVSTPVHTQTTDELPAPPPRSYVGPKYKNPMSNKYNQQKRSSFGPLTEMTNQDGDWSEF